MVVGGGQVAERKCCSLLEALALVTIIAPRITPLLEELHAAQKISVLRRPWQPGDSSDAHLIFAATCDNAVNASVAEEARSFGIPVCVADAPLEGTFTSPAVIRRGELLITISTNGRSPALARRLRRDLEAYFGPEYADIVEIAGKLREKQLTSGPVGAYNNQLYNELLAGDLTCLLDPELRDQLYNDSSKTEPGNSSLPTDTEDFP